MDETGKQLTKETRKPNSSVILTMLNIMIQNMNVMEPQIYFMFFNPIEGKRRVDVTDNRTAKDWAQQIKQLVDVDYPDDRKNYACNG